MGDSQIEVKQDTVASDSQKEELGKETTILQKEEELKVTKEAETNDPALITSLVGNIATTIKEEEKTQDEAKAKDSQIEVKQDTVASDSQKEELGKETTILKKKEELQVTKEAETNDPALITSLVGNIVTTMKGQTGGEENDVNGKDTVDSIFLQKDPPGEEEKKVESEANKVDVSPKATPTGEEEK